MFQHEIARATTLLVAIYPLQNAKCKILDVWLLRRAFGHRARREKFQKRRWVLYIQILIFVF
jgi:hypothetical protein